MSRSADNRFLWLPAAVALVATLLTAVAPTPTAGASPPAVEVPEEAITAPVVDVYIGTSSIDGTLTVEERRRATASRLDASALFDLDSARLKPTARNTIADLARELANLTPAKITVTGYTDDLGSAAHGLDLSRRRAKSVAAELKNRLGPDWPTITTVGRGEADPAVPNTGEKNRQLNRRVVITVDH